MLWKQIYPAICLLKWHNKKNVKMDLVVLIKQRPLTRYYHVWPNLKNYAVFQLIREIREGAFKTYSNRDQNLITAHTLRREGNICCDKNDKLLILSCTEAERGDASKWLSGLYDGHVIKISIDSWQLFIN